VATETADLVWERSDSHQ